MTWLMMDVVYTKKTDMDVVNVLSKSSLSGLGETHRIANRL